MVALGGCPDADEDGIADKDDECPDVAGPAENNGCPWPDTDNDGIADKDDACSELSGKGERPILTDEVLSTINQVGDNILFASDSSKQGEDSMAALENIKKILDEIPTGSIVIEGHASDGREDYNQKLSLKRAESVRDKLIELGVDAARLSVKAMGTQPLNGDDSDLANNRERVLQAVKTTLPNNKRAGFTRLFYCNKLASQRHCGRHSSKTRGLIWSRQRQE